MTLPLTPDSLAAAYEYLRTTPPFRRWKLPPADEVEFHVTRHRVHYGDHDLIGRGQNRRHCIRASTSEGMATTTNRLLMTIAHEMIHAYQDGVTRTGSWKTTHNREFHRLAARVCKIHGWILQEFV